MEIDQRRLTSLILAIDSAISAVDPEHRATSGKALPRAYAHLRREAVEVLPGDRDLLAEFGRVCPESGRPLGGTVWRDPVYQAEAYSEAVTSLKVLSGWLRGFLPPPRPKPDVGFG